MSVVTIIVALILAFIAWKVLTGVIKIGALVLVGAVAIYLISRGGLA